MIFSCWTVVVLLGVVVMLVLKLDFSSVVERFDGGRASEMQQCAFFKATTTVC